MPAEAPGPQATPDKSWWDWALQVPRLILGQLSYVTVYSFPGVALGAVLFYASLFLGRPIHEFPVPMLVGISISMAVAAYRQQPDRVLERKTKRWDELVRRQMLTKKQATELKKKLFEWYEQETMHSLPRSGKLPPLITEAPPDIKSIEPAPPLG
jgi:hypothetical protein